MILPSELLTAVVDGDVSIGWLAVDTETSGLHPDDGARISTVSIAWEMRPSWDGWDIVNHWDRDGQLTFGEEEIWPGYKTWIASVAWPFDQGITGTGKPEDHGQGELDLFQASPNLARYEYECVLSLLRWFGKRKPRLAMHHGKFDCIQFAWGVRIWPDLTTILIDALGWDTQNVNNLLWPLQKTGLDDTALRLWGKGKVGVDKLKGWLKKHKFGPGRYDLVPWDILGPYADYDARMTIMLFLRQVYEIRKQNAAHWFKDPQSVDAAVQRRLETSRILFWMQHKGLPYDEVGSRIAGQEVAVRALKLAEGLPFRPPTEPRAKQYWFTEQDLTPYGLTEKGAPSLTAEIVDRMVGDGVQYAQEWREYSKAKTAAEMWYFGYADKVGTDGRLRTSFRQNHVVSTRFSVERVNLQAIPANYRLEGYASLDGIPTPRQLIAAGVPDGWGIWELDLRQAELRVGALYSGCTSMLEMMERGDDLHNYTTTNLFHVEPGSSQWPMYRQVGKRGNFSLGFDAGPDTFAKMISKETGMILKFREAKRIVDGWRELFPEWHEAVEYHMRKVIWRQQKYGNGWIEFKNGERRWWQRYEDAHKAFNQRVQGTLAQFGIDWMIATQDFLSDDEELEEMGGGLILTIHDSQALLLPLDRGQELATRCASFADELWKQWFPGVGGGSDFKMWKKAA